MRVDALVLVPIERLGCHPVKVDMSHWAPLGFLWPAATLRLPIFDLAVGMHAQAQLVSAK